MRNPGLSQGSCITFPGSVAKSGGMLMKGPPVPPSPGERTDKLRPTSAHRPQCWAQGPLASAPPTRVHCPLAFAAAGESSGRPAGTPVSLRVSSKRSLYCF